MLSYHQVKRMFHGIGNRVTTVHRERIGLPDDLPLGGWRPSTKRAEMVSRWSH